MTLCFYVNVMLTIRNYARVPVFKQKGTSYLLINLYGVAGRVCSRCVSTKPHVWSNIY